MNYKCLVADLGTALGPPCASPVLFAGTGFMPSSTEPLRQTTQASKSQASRAQQTNLSLRTFVLADPVFGLSSTGSVLVSVPVT